MKRLFCLLGPCIALLLSAADSPSVPHSRMNEPRWAGEYARKQALLASRPYDVVVLGDSIVHELDHSGGEDWNDFRSVWDNWFVCRNAVTLGFTGDTTADLLWRIQNGLLPESPPKLFVVLIGTNNNRPTLDWSSSETAAAIREIATELHTTYKKSAIIVLGVPPNGQGPRVAQLIKGTNAILAHTDWERMNAHFVPTSDIFTRDDVLDTSLFREPHLGKPALHPSAQGWDVLAHKIIDSAAAFGILNSGQCRNK